ncbi:hypothetical protein M9458_038435, partial [Cirrhinus mrigala]
DTSPTLTVLPPSRDELQQASKGYPSDWTLSWKVNGCGRGSGVNLSPSQLQKDGLLTESEWSTAIAISCEATHPSHNAVTKSFNTQQC